MGTNQNNDIDFSDYRPEVGQTPVFAASPPDLDRESRKRKIQLGIVAVCLILAIGFWGYYFYSQSAKNRISETDIIPAEMIPE